MRWSSSVCGTARRTLAATSWVAVVGLTLVVVPASAQQAPPPSLPAVALPDGPLLFETAEHAQIRLVVVTRGLSHPWGLAFLPDGRLLVTERGGRLRVIRDGVLDPHAVSGVPEVHAVGLAGLMDVALHPRFAENQQVYLTYSKPGDDGVRVALARGRLTGLALTDVRDHLRVRRVGRQWDSGVADPVRVGWHALYDGGRCLRGGDGGAARPGPG